MDRPGERVGNPIIARCRNCHGLGGPANSFAHESLHAPEGRTSMKGTCRRRRKESLTNPLRPKSAFFAVFRGMGIGLPKPRYSRRPRSAAFPVPQGRETI